MQDHSKGMGVRAVSLHLSVHGVANLFVRTDSNAQGRPLSGQKRIDIVGVVCGVCVQMSAAHVIMRAQETFRNSVCREVK